MRRTSFRTPIALASAALAALLFIAGGLLIWGSTYIHNTVHDQLASQQIYFPPQSAFAHPQGAGEITPSMIPSVSQYAGQQLADGQQAEAYANHFIAVHIQNMTGGKTYSQLSTQAQSQPNNTTLARSRRCSSWSPGAAARAARRWRSVQDRTARPRSRSPDQARPIVPARTPNAPRRLFPRAVCSPPYLPLTFNHVYGG
jgi:hypothetical protein